MPGGPFRVIYPDIPDNYRTRLDLQWPIYTFGRLDALGAGATAEADATARTCARPAPTCGWRSRAPTGRS